MQTYTKINTLYKRYQNLGDKCPNPKWRKFQNCIIKGCFSDASVEYLKDCLWEGYSKIDGTNSKICFFPSAGKVMVGGKTDKASSQHGQFEMLQEIADKIQPRLCEMFPKENAKFMPVKGEDNRVKYWDKEFYNVVEPIGEDFFGVELKEVPVYVYGEYFGKGIQKSGGRYSDDNHFIVFDIDMQGWWLPKNIRDMYCNMLGLETVPYIGTGTISEFEKMVSDGFATKLEWAKDKALIEEGIVARPVLPVKDTRGNRIMVKIKYEDYNKWNLVRKEFTDDEFNEFNKWYNENIEVILNV